MTDITTQASTTPPPDATTTIVALTHEQTADMLQQAQSAAQAIANSATVAVSSDQFVYFAAFDGTRNDSTTDSAQFQTTAIAQLYSQVQAASPAGGNTQAAYYPGVGTDSSLWGSAWYPPNVTQQTINAAFEAYTEFAFSAYLWSQAHPNGSITSVIAGFSRGCASEAIFAQMLYEKGLVYDGQILIPAGSTGAVSAALVIDPVLTFQSGNMDFPPGVQNLTVVRAENEYRDQFYAADYGNDSQTSISAPGCHCDVGDGYDNGLGGIYLEAFTNFFRNAGLNINPVDPGRAYDPSKNLVLHSENLPLINSDRKLYDTTYNPGNDLTIARRTASAGSPADVQGNGSAFTIYDGTIVLNGNGYSYSYSYPFPDPLEVVAPSIYHQFVMLPDAVATIDETNGANVVPLVGPRAFADVKFSSDDKLKILNFDIFKGTLSDFSPGNTLDLVGIGVATTAALGADNVLALTGGMSEASVTFGFSAGQDFSIESFLIAPDGSGGTIIAGLADDAGINFTGNSEMLLVPNPENLVGTITGFQPGDTIDLAGIGTATVATLGANNVLTVTGGSSGFVTLQMDPSTNYANKLFAAVSDGGDGTDIVIVNHAPFLIYLPSDFGDLPRGINYLPGVSISENHSEILHQTFTLEISAPFPLNVTPVDGAVVSGANSDNLTLVGDIGSINTELSSLNINLPKIGHYQHFEVTFDGNDGLGGHLQLACFAAGGCISTQHGDSPVEGLAVGDRLHSRSAGGLCSIVWIGHRSINCRRHPRPHDVWPVRIAADAFGQRLPHRALLLSPDHAVFIDGVLIPIRYLINGTTIVQQPVDEVTYYHVELERHDVILAEGLPCESYLDAGNRSAFANGGALVQMHPDFAMRVWETKACAPLVMDGPKLEAARRMLLAQAETLGHGLTSDPALVVFGEVGALTPQVSGQRWSVVLPEGISRVRLTSRSWIPAQTRADEYDTRQLGIAIARLWLDGREASLESPALGNGWHAPEPDWRWTDGGGELSVEGVRALSFEIAMMGTYWRDPPGKMAIAA